ncbi:hypothetical protein N665_0168s0002 [Sinapis alba]|nr:hypothetical protein N665_0168s0002 [Sinapis alba]
MIRSYKHSNTEAKEACEDECCAEERSTNCLEWGGHVLWKRSVAGLLPSPCSPIFCTMLVESFCLADIVSTLSVPCSTESGWSLEVCIFLAGVY